MAFSVITNNAAAIALQSLTSISKSLEKTQLNISTGLKVNGPQDDASTFAIAQNQRGEVAGLESVASALANGKSIVDVAITAGQSIADLTVELKAKVVQANQAGLDANSRSALNNDFIALRDQILEVTRTAEFNGVNLVQSGATATSVLSTVDGSTIAVSAQTFDPTSLGIQSATLSSSANAATALTAIDSAITTVSSKLAALGSVSTRIDVQSDFSTKLRDILKTGIGNLVDADLAEESANLQALQIQQQLGVQALSIANSSPQTILGLF